MRDGKLLYIEVKGGYKIVVTSIGSSTAASKFAAFKLFFTVPPTFDFAPDEPGVQTANYFREQCVPFSLTPDKLFAPEGDPNIARVAVFDTSALDTLGFAGKTRLALTGSAADAKPGTTENVECSNRGLCDYSTGICKCFAGFTTEDCSVQNSLSMGG